MVWRLSQKPGVVPKYRARRRAVPTLTPRAPLTISEMRDWGMPVSM